MSRVKIVGIIPARFASTRFPGKPLALIAGKPLIQHVVERCQQARALSDVVVATVTTGYLDVLAAAARVDAARAQVVAAQAVLQQANDRHTSGLAARIDVTRDGGGECDERAVLERGDHLLRVGEVPPRQLHELRVAADVGDHEHRALNLRRRHGR